MSLFSFLKWSIGGSSKETPTGMASPATKNFFDASADQCAATVLAGDDVNDTERTKALKAFQSSMALVPMGPVPARRGYPGEGGFFNVAAVYFDRYAVTNQQYLRFMQSGGYDNMDFWPREIWSSVVQFVDQTGFTAPAYWENGKPARGTESWPVVGLSWFEAAAYATWAGKRLPTSVEWERAGTWPGISSGQGFRRFPWGNAFDPSKGNTWTAGLGHPVPVTEYDRGATPNGVYQLIGNVWEWNADEYFGPSLGEDEQLFFDYHLATIKGGAFDTYFEQQATCQFESGQPYLSRRTNIGFRCAISSADVQHMLTEEV